MGIPVRSDVLLLFLSVLSLSGCARPQLCENATQAITVSGVTTEQAVEAAETVLHQMRFQIAKADAQAGLVRTLPLTGAQFFEFWRSDNIDLSDTVEANLHTLRRAVLLDFDQTDGAVHMRCTIRVQRLSLPENDAASVSQAYQMHSRSTRTMQRIDLNPSQTEVMSWIELGDDPKLAAEILRKIARSITRPEKDETT